MIHQMIHQIVAALSCKRSKGFHSPQRSLSIRLEIDQAKDQKLQEIQTGPRILQSPTAALCAISLLQAQFGDL